MSVNYYLQLFQHVAKALTRLGDVALKCEDYDQAIDYYNQSLLEQKEYSVRKKLKMVGKNPKLDILKLFYIKQRTF